MMRRSDEETRSQNEESRGRGEREKGRDLLPGDSGDPDALLSARVLVLGDKLDGATPSLGDGSVVLGQEDHTQGQTVQSHWSSTHHNTPPLLVVLGRAAQPTGLGGLHCNTTKGWLASRQPIEVKEEWISE